LRLAGIKVLPEDAQPLSPYLYVNANVQWQLERNPLYRFSPHEKEDFLTQEIRTLMAEFGAEVYSVPPEFAERAGHYIELYQGPDRPLVAKVLNGSAGQLAVMRQILREERLPVDLAYIPLVESALASDKPSPAGALGPWQLTPVTARAFGLRVDKQIDERTNLAKSTRASCRFLRNLILDFGAGSSVMLALAAYNLGPSRVKQAIMDTVRDPIKQRDFWYLYRANALPRETREYVPKVVAAMIVGRNPQHFGF
jgi:membrane-bound lytic murein transglycosylase D